MAYKTILLHFDDEAQAPALINLARQIASQHAAHLIGLFVVHPLELYTGQSVGAGVAGEYTSLLAKEQLGRMQRIKNLFEEKMHNQNFVAEWRFIDERASQLENTVLREATTADLLILGQYSGSCFTQDIANHVLLASPVPVLLVPKDYSNNVFGQNVLVAWDQTAEVARAVGGSLPLLKRAHHVMAHYVLTKTDAIDSIDAKFEKFSNKLSRHGVTVEMSESKADRENIGKTIFNIAKSQKADCIVMGAFGHSRIRSLILGNTTDYALENMHIPVLMWH